jgi:hypothetical protein
VLCCAGVAPEKLKRTPSLSALDELVMGRDSDQQQQCNVFMLKVCATVHTVHLHMHPCVSTSSSLSAHLAVRLNLRTARQHTHA